MKARITACIIMAAGVAIGAEPIEGVADWKATSSCLVLHPNGEACSIDSDAPKSVDVSIDEAKEIMAASKPDVDSALIVAPTSDLSGAVVGFDWASVKEHGWGAVMGTHKKKSAATIVGTGVALYLGYEAIWGGSDTPPDQGLSGTIDVSSSGTASVQFDGVTGSIDLKQERNESGSGNVTVSIQQK